MGTSASGGWKLALLLVVFVACYRSPADDFYAFVDRVGDTAADAVDASDLGKDSADFGAAEIDDITEPTGIDLTGTFVLVFQTELKPEASSDVLLVLTQQGSIREGNAEIGGEARSREEPEVQLGSIPAVAISPEGRFDMKIENFIIPPGVEPLLPDGGTAELILTAAIVDANSFCGPLDFHLLTPMDLHQNGEFATYRQDVVPVGEAGCP